MKRLAAPLLAAAVGCAGAGCGPAERAPEQLAAEVQAALVRGAAHAEVEEWSSALALFEEAWRLAPGEPALAFDAALASLRLGQPERAAEWLAEIGEAAPPELRARAAFLRGRLAVEAGDAAAEADAYRRAAALDPNEPAYPYALSRVVPRLGEAEAVGDLLERAHRLWPANTRIAAELAQWLLGHDDPENRRRGLRLIEGLVSPASQPEIAALVDRGRAELASDPSAGSPVALRQALNLLRPGKRFQADSAVLEERLQVLPFAEPAGAELRRRRSTTATLPTFLEAPLLPALPLAPSTAIRQVVASNDAVELPGNAAREADLTVLTDDALWFLGRDDDGFRRLAETGPDAQILVGELDGDGWMEIALLGDRGVRLFGRHAGTDWAERPLAPALAAARLHRGLLVDFEHDGDLDLLAAADDDRLLLVLHRGEAGWGAPGPAPLPAASNAGPLLATDLDGDADQDLLLADGETLRVLTNLRQGEFAAGGELPAGAKLTRLLSLDRDGDGRLDVVGLAGGRLVTWRNAPDRGLVSGDDATPGAGTAAALHGFAAGDPDLDGDRDLVAAGGGRLLLYPSSRPEPRPAPPVVLVAEGAADRDGVAVLDLDGDRAPDLLTWGEGGLATWRSTGVEEAGWLVLGLRGLAGKVPLDGRGARIEAAWGVERHALETDRPEVLLGTGERPPDLVKVTWPNGISEYLHAPAAAGRYRIEQVLRIEGSCPFLYASDGAAIRFVTDILGLSPLGMLAAPGRYVTPDPEEYLRLPEWVAPAGGVYELRITEELREVAYLDQTELVVIDAPREVEVYNGEQWIEPPVRGLDLRLLGPLRAPASVLADDGSDAFERVVASDHRYLTNHRGRRLYQGATPPHSVVLQLPADLAGAPRPALVLFGWLHWGNTSVNVARAQDPAGAPVFPYLEVPDGDGGWRRLAAAVGLPAGKTKPVVVDLTGVVSADRPRLRLTTDFEVYWDRIAVTEILPAGTPHHETRLAPAAAELSYGGFSRWYRPAPNGPYLFDYADRRSIPRRAGDGGRRPIAWREHAGWYTPFGEVSELLGEADDRLVVFGSGEELALRFDAAHLPPPPPGWRRTLFLHTEGWEKDGDPNVACSETVGPLPFRAMRVYPCPGGAAAPDPVRIVPDGSSPRWVGAERLQRRVAAAATAPAPGEAP